MTSNGNGREEFVRGLREMAEFYESNESFPLPIHGTRVSLYVQTKEELFKLSKRLGTFDKDLSQNWAGANKVFGGGHTIAIFTDRNEVCKRVVKEVIEVPETVVPAHTQEIVEWECDEPWLAKGSDN